MYKRKCSESLTKSNSHQTVHVPDPPVRRSSSGSSLSPLLAAIYLIPLDKAFSQHPDFFYRRYMDDWVIICHSRRALRQETFTGEFGVRKISVIFQVFYKNKFNSTAIERIFRKKLGNLSYFCSSNLACKGLSTTLKKVYTIMKSLNVEIHPDKTWLGRVKNGFDFLGFRMSPTTIQPSTESVSRRDKKIARLYEQGASTKRIGQYLRRWLGWSIVSCTAWSSAYAAPAASCNVTITGGTFVSLALSSSTGAATATLQVTEGAIGTTFNSLGPHCLTASPPDGDPSICDADPVQIIDGSPFYVTSYIPATDEYCEYTVTVSAAGSSAVNSIARSVPTAVPIFSPFGLLVMSGALIWYGRRRQATVLVKN